MGAVHRITFDEFRLALERVGPPGCSGGRKIGAVLNLAILQFEAVFWIGFALPLPWLTGVARVAIVAGAWKSLSGSGKSHRAHAVGAQGTGVTNRQETERPVRPRRLARA